jgi:hypothetical protein
MLIAPQGMSFKGDKLTERGVEPRTQANIYETSAGPFTILVEGAGTLRGQTQESSSDEERGNTPIDVIQPRIYDRVYWILGIAFALLGIAFFRLYGRPAA